MAFNRHFLFFLLVCILLGLTFGSPNGGSSSESKGDTKNKPKEWPPAIVEGGKNSGLGAAGYVAALRENCNVKKIVGACQVLETNNIPLESTRDEL